MRPFEPFGCLAMGVALWGVCLWGSPAVEAAERLPDEPLVEYEIDTLPRELERPSETFWQFLELRTQLGVGFDENYSDNLLLQDNNKQEELVSTLEGEIFFSDPRGSLLYGLDYEVNAFRYHRTDGNAVNHDFRAFVDFDPRTRYQYRLNYRMAAQNSLLLGPQEIDLLRRSADFQRSVNHQVTGKLRYDLNDTNALVPQLSYETLDDQARNDADTDRREWKAILDVDHDLKPGWTLFSGYEFDRIAIPGNKLKNSDAHAFRLGTRYEVTRLTKLDTTFKVIRREFKSSQKDTDFGFEGTWNYAIGPRTLLDLRYADQQGTSFAAGRRRFRSRTPSLKIQYELSPLTTLSTGATYEKQRSGGQDVLTGAAATSVVSRRYAFTAGTDWQFREKGHITLDYLFQRSKSSDYTNHQVTFGIEMEL